MATAVDETVPATATAEPPPETRKEALESDGAPAPRAAARGDEATRRRLALAALLVAFAVEAQKPDELPRFEGAAESVLVEVPVHVHGRDGLPIRGLTKESFELYDDGDRVEISSFEAIDLEDFSKGLAPADLPLPTAARRHFMLLFDLSFSTPVKMAMARTAARDFVLNGLKNGDHAAVATYDVEKGMRLVLAFTADRDQLAAGVETLGLPSFTQPMSDPLALTLELGPSAYGSGGMSQGAGRGDEEMVEQLQTIAAASRKSFDSYQRGRVSAMIQSFEDMARTLNSVRGRKHILYFSEGLDSRLLVGATSANAGRTEGDQIAFGEVWKVDNENRYGSTDLKGKLDAMLALFRRSDCVIHSFDISGLKAGADIRSATAADAGSGARDPGAGRGRDSLFMFANETGGQVFQYSNDLPGQLEKLQQQTALVYLLVFSPARLKEPGRYHALKVKVKAPGATASARAGYYEPRPFAKLTAMERRLATAQLIAYGLPRTEIPSQVLAAPFKVKGKDRWEVPVVVEIPGDKAIAGSAGQTVPLEIYAYVTDAQLRVRDFLSQNLTLDLGKLRQQLTASGVKFYGTLYLPPGSYWLKVLVRNAETGRTGLQIVPVAVPLPERKDLYVLPPLFQETPGRWVMVKGNPRPQAQESAGYPFTFEGRSFIPAAGATLAAGSAADLCLFAYDPGGAEALQVEGRVKGTDGKDRGEVRLKVVRSTPAEGEGMKRLLCSFESGQLPPGGYSLLVTVRNPGNGQEAQSAARFWVR